MSAIIYTLTVYRDGSRRDITNIEDFVTNESLDNAIEYYNTYYADRGLPYTIEETYEEKITDLNPCSDDNVIDENFDYWVAPDCEEWTDYYWPYKTLEEAKLHAKECMNIEHCDVHIIKRFKKLLRDHEEIQCHSLNIQN